MLNYIKINSKMLGISLPQEILLRIDKDRGEFQGLDSWSN